MFGWLTLILCVLVIGTKMQCDEDRLEASDLEFDHVRSYNEPLYI